MAICHTNFNTASITGSTCLISTQCDRSSITQTLILSVSTVYLPSVYVVIFLDHSYFMVSRSCTFASSNSMFPSLSALTSLSTVRAFVFNLLQICFQLLAFFVFVVFDLGLKFFGILTQIFFQLLNDPFCSAIRSIFLCSRLFTLCGL